MSKSSWIILVLIIVVAVSVGYWGVFGSHINPMSLYKTPTSTPHVTPPTIPPPPAIQVPGEPNSSSSPITESTITYTDAGFSPTLVTVTLGAKVTFINNSSSPFRPSSNPHPIHTDYPDTAANKCGTADGSIMFDSCKAIEPGSSWTFTFNHVGTWGYHDHRKPENLGTIMVTLPQDVLPIK